MKKIISLVLCVAMLTCMVAVSSAETSLRVAWWGGQERHNQTIEALDAYGAANDIKMEYEYTSWTSYFENLATQAVGHNLPDMLLYPRKAPFPAAWSMVSWLVSPPEPTQ